VRIDGSFSSPLEALEDKYGGEKGEEGEESPNNGEVEVHGRPFAAGESQAWIGAPIKATTMSLIAEGSGLRGRRTLEESGPNVVVRCNNVVLTWLIKDGSIDQHTEEEDWGEEEEDRSVMIHWVESEKEQEGDEGCQESESFPAANFRSADHHWIEFIARALTGSLPDNNKKQATAPQGQQEIHFGDDNQKGRQPQKIEAKYRNPSTARLTKCREPLCSGWRKSGVDWAVRGLVVFALGVGEGVVAFAGLDLLAGLAGDVESAEGAVDFEVGGGEAGEVLGAKLVLDLVEGFLKLFAVVAYVDDAASGVGGEFLHVALAGVGEVDAEASAAVEASVGEEDDVDDGVGFLSGFGGGLEGLLGALVAAVGEQDENLASGFLSELVVGGEVDGVEEESASGGAVAGDRAGAGAGVDLGGVHGASDLAGAVGVVGEFVDVDVEGD
jgi:hypothetical protein